MAKLDTGTVARAAEKIAAKEPFDVLVLGGIEEAGAVATDPHHAGLAQLGEVLGHRRRACADVVGQVVDRVLAVQERPDDLQSGRVDEKLEQGGSRIELGRGWFSAYLRGHAAILVVRPHREIRLGRTRSL